MSVEGSWFDRSHWLAYSKTAKLRPICFVWSLIQTTSLSYNPKTFVNIKKSADIYNNGYRRGRSFAKSSTTLSSVNDRANCIPLTYQH